MYGPGPVRVGDVLTGHINVIMSFVVNLPYFWVVHISAIYQSAMSESSQLGNKRKQMELTSIMDLWYKDSCDVIEENFKRARKSLRVVKTANRVLSNAYDQIKADNQNLLLILREIFDDYPEIAVAYRSLVDFEEEATSDSDSDYETEILESPPPVARRLNLG